MHSIAILGFFSLVVMFFFIGKDDFGLKPSQKINSNLKMDLSQNTKLEEVNN